MHRRDWGALILIDERFAKCPQKYTAGLFWTLPAVFVSVLIFFANLSLLMISYGEFFCTLHMFDNFHLAKQLTTDVFQFTNVLARCFSIVVGFCLFVCENY